jgi:hypothetical protein
MPLRLSIERIGTEDHCLHPLRTPNISGSLSVSRPRGEARGIKSQRNVHCQAYWCSHRPPSSSYWPCGMRE